MREIIIKSLHIENFKGFREETIHFAHETHIRGRNELGKTTIFDAFCWLLFGKDSTGDSRFKFKPYDTDPASPTYGQEIHKLTTAVTAIFYVDNTEVTLAKVSEENWVKPNGQEERVYQGNNLTCYCDGMKRKMKEFEAIVSGFVDEDRFRLLTDPMYFNRLHWEDQRQIVVEVVGEPTHEEVIECDPEQLQEINTFLDNCSVEEMKKQLGDDIRNRKAEN